MMTELSPQLTAEQASRIIAADIKAYPQGGDKREEHLRLFGALLSREVIDGAWAARYAEVERQAKAKATPQVFERREFSDEQIKHWQAERASFFGSWAQPKAAPELENTSPKRKASVAGVVRSYLDAVEPKRKPEPEQEPEEAAQQGEIVTNTQIALPTIASAAKATALLNQKHHVIGNYGNKCVILSWEQWEINRNVIIPTFQRFEDFKHRYMNRYVWKPIGNGMKRMAAGEFWLSDPNRLTYDSVTFRPNEPQVLSGNRLNLWRGFGVFPSKGSWKLMRNHIYRVLGAGDPKAGRYIIRWLAYTLQHPGEVGETVLVLQGHEGTGKGTLARAMLKIFGPHGLPVSQPKHLTGGFSGHLQHCCFLFLDEAFWAGDVQAEGRLKSLITEDTITIEPKYFTPFQVPNLLHIMMSSNNDWVVPAGPHARRYAVFKVSDERMNDFAYFSALRAELANGGVEAMLYDLLKVDLGDWHPMQIYKTAALTEQKQRSLRGLDAWIETMLQEGLLPSGLEAYPNRCYTEDLTAQAKEFDRYTNDVLVTAKLKELLKVEPFGGVKRGWKFLPLPDCRKLWEARFGAEWPWHREVSEWQVRRREWHG